LINRRPVANVCENKKTRNSKNPWQKREPQQQTKLSKKNPSCLQTKLWRTISHCELEHSLITARTNEAFSSRLERARGSSKQRIHQPSQLSPIKRRPCTVVHILLVPVTHHPHARTCARTHTHTHTKSTHTHTHTHSHTKNTHTTDTPTPTHKKHAHAHTHTHTPTQHAQTYSTHTQRARRHAHLHI
jgi:hypothetical protein